MGSVVLPGKGVAVEGEQQTDGTFRQSVKVAESVLPAGAASEVTLASLNAAADAIKVATEALAGRTINTGAISGTVAVSNFPATQPVSAATLPLPTGASTEATLSTIAGAVKAEDSPAVSGDPGIPFLAMRQIADTTSTDADGDYTLIKIDEEGRVKVATKPASFDLVTGNITASAQTVFCDVRRASNVQAHMVAASLVGHNVTFEGSIDSTNGTDGNWFAIQLLRSNANTIELTSGVLAATPAYGWEASVNGLSFLRVRATAHTSGTATWKFQRGSYATEPIPAAQISGTQPVSGTVTANLAASTNLAADVGLQARANATGAGTAVALVVPATPAGTSVKTTAGRLLSLNLSNVSAAVRYVKFYNSATAPTMGTTSAAYQVAIPAGGSINLTYPHGIGFSAGMFIAVTGGISLTDNTAITANDVVGFVTYA